MTEYSVSPMPYLGLAEALLTSDVITPVDVSNIEGRDGFAG